MRKRPMCQAAAVFVLGLLAVCMKILFWTILLMIFLLTGFLTVKRDLSDYVRQRRIGRLIGCACILSAVFFAGAAVMIQASAVTAEQETEDGSQITVTGKIVDYELKNDNVIFYIQSTSKYHRIMVTMSYTSYISYVQKKYNSLDYPSIKESISSRTSEKESISSCTSEKESILSCISEKENNPEDISKKNIEPIQTVSLYGTESVDSDIEESQLAGINDIREGIGTIISVTGTKVSFTSPTNPGQFDQKAYYKGLNVDFKMKDAQIAVLEAAVNPFLDGLHRLQGRFTERLYEMTDEKTAGTLSAMLFGDKTSLDSDLKALYQRNGISHVLAISGLHISILGMCLFRLLRRFGCPLIPAALSGAALTVCFGLVAGMPVSAMRAVIMYCVSMIAQIAGRTYDLPSAIALAVILVLIDRPYAIFQASMQLSFGAVLSLQLLPENLPKFSESRFAERLFHNYLIAGKPVSKTVSSKVQQRQVLFENGILLAVTGIDYIIQGLSVSLTIQLVTLPVQLYHFFYIPVYAGLLNLVVIPAMSVILLSGMCGVLVSMLPVWKGISAFTELCFWPCKILLQIYEWLCTSAENLPGNLLCFGQPKLWQIAAFYFLLLLSVIFVKRSGKKNRSSRAAGIISRRKGILSLFLVILGVCILRHVRYPGLEITMLDIGQGDAICLQLPDGTTLLNDGGSSSLSQIGQYRIKPYLLSQGILTVDAVLISHWDSDHISGIEELLEENGQEITIKTLILPDVPNSADDELVEFVTLAENAGVSVQYAAKGDVLQISDVTITCLAPSSELTVTDRNECSMVFTLSYGEFQMLFIGDLPETQESALLESAAADASLLDCQVLKVAHHGSKYSTSEAFLEMVTPVISIISCGADNSYGHPHAELLERLENAGSSYYVTAQQGAICLRVKKNGRYSLEFGAASYFEEIFR